MPKLNFVKKAYKDNPVAKKGESYYWWQFFKRPKQFSKTRPTRVQLTGSAFLSSVYSIEDEGLPSIENTDGVQDYITEIEDLRDQCQESHDNMPEGLQEGDTGILLQERVDYLEQWIDELESIKDQYENEDEDQSVDEKEEELSNFRDEISSCSYEGD